MSSDCSQTSGGFVGLVPVAGNALVVHNLMLVGRIKLPQREVPRILLND